MSGISQRMNFLRETEEAIQKAGYSPDRIRRIGSWLTRYHCTWDQLREIADFDYEPEAGDLTIASDLTIEFDDGSALRRDSIEEHECWNHYGREWLNKSYRIKTVRAGLGGRLVA